MSNKSISRVVQDLKNIQIVKKLCDNSSNSGSYENLYVCKKKGDPNQYVCKIIKEKMFNPLEFAIAKLMSNNVNFIDVYNCYYTKKGHVILIMDYVVDGDLFELVKSKQSSILDEALCRKILINLITALNDLHAQQFIHNDVKLENLLFDIKRKRLYLCDFGLVKCINVPSHYDGTTIYFSPEKIAKIPCTQSFDWWAVGIVAYELLSKNYPFEFDEEEEDEINPKEMMNIYKQPLKKIPNISKNAMDFVRQMLMLDINKRLSTYDQIIKHPFLNI
ncbi:pk-1 [Adoxophyes orana granulovirus]|uniref:PK-1 n=1 Tax=Adoxophyes orana granulovirus TaxID=170617 RepID=Q91B72_GVAO|nr:pk-1 [Adoxophyes orana granulovirus]AAL02084.1 protein kinase [Adoxophyes orana granulovirus]AAP85640.1 pk-1 [Adoxophyes orana granulovirus]AJA91643.1 PK-1 [Adoxophyes orana granulovirus]